VDLYLHSRNTPSWRGAQLITYLIKQLIGIQLLQKFRTFMAAN